LGIIRAGLTGAEQTVRNVRLTQTRQPATSFAVA
jgi:hypothetical protein